MSADLRIRHRILIFPHRPLWTVSSAGGANGEQPCDASEMMSVTAPRRSRIGGAEAPDAAEIGSWQLVPLRVRDRHGSANLVSFPGATCAPFSVEIGSRSPGSVNSLRERDHRDVHGYQLARTKSSCRFRRGRVHGHRGLRPTACCSSRPPCDPGRVERSLGLASGDHVQHQREVEL